MRIYTYFILSTGWCCYRYISKSTYKQHTFVGDKEVTPSLTLLTLEAALVIEILEFKDSFEPVLLKPDGGIPGPECTTQEPGLRLDGDLLTLEIGANKP